MNHRGARRFRLVDLSVVLTLCLVGLGGCLMATSRSREQASRVKCASNLRQIGQGIQMYQREPGELSARVVRRDRRRADGIHGGAVA